MSGRYVMVNMCNGLDSSRSVELSCCTCVVHLEFGIVVCLVWSWLVTLSLNKTIFTSFVKYYYVN